MSTITVQSVVVPNWQRGGSTATLRIVSNDDFLTSDSVQIFSGNADHGTFYKIVNCTVSGTDLTIPSFTIDSTTDSSNPNASYHAILYDSNGARADTYWSNHRIPTIFGSNPTQAQLFTYNAAARGIIQYPYPNIDQVQTLIDEAVSGIIAGGASVTSAAHTSAVNRLSGLSSQVTSADGALSTRIDSVANAASVLSQALSALSQANSSEHAALSLRITSVAGGAGSVTSNELSAGLAGQSARTDSVANAISVVSVAVQANSAQMTSADNAISNAVSIVSVAVQTNSAQMTSADNALSTRVDSVANAISVLSQGLSALSQATSAGLASQSVRTDSVANAISVLSQQASILSVAIATNSAQMTSADNANSAAIVSVQSILSTTRSSLSALSADVTSAKNRLSALSTQVTSADNAISNAVSIVSAAQAVTSANVTSVRDLLSGRADSLANAVSVVSQALSAGLAGLSVRINSVNVASLNSVGDVSVNGVTDGQVLMYNSAAGQWIASTVAAGTGSVTSNELSAVSAAAASADNTLSTRIDSVGNAISVLSQQASVLSARVAGVSAQMTSADNAISAAVVNKTISTLVGVSIAGAVDAQVLVYNSAAGQWVASTIAAGSGSVTSNEASAISAAAASAAATLSTRIDSVANAVSVLSQGLSVVSQAVSAGLATQSVRTDSVANAISVLSQQISVISQQVSVLSARVAGVSAQMTSADNAISNAVSIVSAAQAVTSANVTSVRDLLSGRADSLANAISVVSQALSALSNANSASHVSLDGRATSLANAVSIVSQALSAGLATLSARTDSVANAVSVVSNALSALSQTNSSQHAGLSTRIDSVGALAGGAAEYAGGNISASSVIVNWANGYNQAFSILANTPFAAPTGLSAGATYVMRLTQDGTGNRQPTWNATWVWPNGSPPTLGGANAVDILGFYSDGTNIFGNYNVNLSAISASLSNLISSRDALSNSLSVMSNQASALSADLSTLTSAQATLSNQLSNLNSIASVLSQKLSVINTMQQTALLSIVTISATALTNIPALSLTLSAGGHYRVEGMLLYSFSGASSGNAGIGMTFPALISSQYGGGGYIMMCNQGQPATASAMRQGAWTGAGSGSNIVSGYTATTSGVPYFAEIQGIMNVSATGSWQIQMKATSSGAGAVHVLPGSHIRTWRIG